MHLHAVNYFGKDIKDDTKVKKKWQMTNYIKVNKSASRLKQSGKM